MNPNPLNNREKAFEEQYIREKEKQLAEKFKAAREQEAKKATEGPSQGQQQGQGIQKSK